MDINLYKPKKDEISLSEIVKVRQEKRKTAKILKISIFSAIFVITCLAVFSSQVLVSNQSSTSWLANLPIIKQIRSLAESADHHLKGEKEDRINILLLGMGGKNHEGGYLTDTIILLSLEPSTKKVAMVSIPRDLAVSVEDLGLKKINAVNALAETEQEGSGSLAVSQAISDILNIPIDYYVRVDFAGFIKIIDDLGGVKVYVDNTVNDLEYPIAGRESADDYASRFEHLYIEKGWQEMDGSLALKYARSRHSAGIEGSDFARARRQQKVIAAVKDKLLSARTLLNPIKISQILGDLNDHISTNLKIWELIKLWDMFGSVDQKNIINKVLDNSESGLLLNTVSDGGAYILLPRSGDFSEIEYMINNIFSDAPEEIKNNITQERATIEVRNGTWINGLASKMTVDLERYGFTVIRVGNSSRQNFQKSVIYDLTYGEKEKSMSLLKEKTGANVSFGLPQWLIDDIDREMGNEKNPIQPDFILVLGQDADSTNSGKENQENTAE
ncbi:hypothetical protein A2303_03485 [Candidatus Falkowbacteria bacterium RIFOXYB2_FULL_47_14]|uniref:Cell envelope-related transcriptional attenuator domain-containing protein n=1 Tax=Candidatus Falkowbacteria bacterium RIFOXYA2_FULL_47_19 TaxID=1797994 RepID=A0A1F5SHR5_9BACT|nr:MAG: hypothetical protein A2227_03035 [Candidatus Falkowbacteria bacterium RIFOXYA2_FULL_47_19]OGF36710.1 MAG: hypothetical protein A2468_02740 [Candidatus Falkowbacteria bacterium RIFOXYC2_FULL_46_15]OGF42463.1 MAG: hypothetical protein A2303_03485 [Candidatus Falkowbacteria bacterium RIFOXYB2_FULL_47_14]